MRQGPKSATVAVNDASSGTIAWTAPGNATASDDVYATVTTNVNNGTTQLLKLTDFGFTVPAGARIDGLLVEVEAKVSAVNTFMLNRTAVVTAGARRSFWSVGYVPGTVEAYLPIGGPGVLLGAELTPADVNDGRFGVAIGISHLGVGNDTISVDHVRLTVYYTAGPAVVTFREARPPHAAFAVASPAALRYGFKLGDVQTGSFLLPRSDPAWQDIDARLTGEPMMVTVERPDGHLPFCGFLSNIQVSQQDPMAQFQIADHAWRLKAARTLRTGSYQMSSGQLIRLVLSEMDRRAEPWLGIDLDGVEDGAPVQYGLAMNNGLSFLQDMAALADMEFGWAYELSSSEVKTHLLWKHRMGADRRGEDAWREQSCFTRVGYELDYGGGVAAVVAVGGSGAFAGRPAAAVSKSGAASDLSAAAVATPGVGLGGTRVVFAQQSTDAAVLQTAARQSLGQPRYAAQKASATVYEAALDMGRLRVGDVVRWSLQDTVPQAPVELDVRVVAIDMDPWTLQHAVVVVVV